MNTTSSPILIALADDHAMLRTSFVAYLNAVNDFQVLCEASNGKQLLDAIQASPMKPHICVLDVSMPVMNGYDTLVALKAMLPEVKVLVLTMIDHEGNFLRMIRAAADGYLPKTEEMEELVYAIRFMAEHGYYQNKGQSKIPILINPNKAKYQLSEKDETFLRLYATELSYKEMAARMDVSEKTVESYRSSLFKRLGVISRTGLAFYALQIGLVPFGYAGTEDNDKGDESF